VTNPTATGLRISVALLVLAALAVACSVPASDDVEVRWLGYDDFVESVQPVLARACGNPSCHGRPERALSIYSTERWRADRDRLFLVEPLTATELEHNYTASCVLVTEAGLPAEALLLRKPLGSRAGVYHGGGDVFDGVTDRDYRKLLQWVEKGW